MQRQSVSNRVAIKRAKASAAKTIRPAPKTTRVNHSAVRRWKASARGIVHVVRNHVAMDSAVRKIHRVQTIGIVMKDFAAHRRMDSARENARVASNHSGMAIAAR